MIVVSLASIEKDILGHSKKGGVMGESPFAEICHPKKRAFLAAYAQTGNKSLAAKMAGIVKQTVYTRQWREDAAFQAAMERARQMAVDVLEDEATRRAVEGWEEPVGWYKGKAGGTIRRYSDTLLIVRLKGELPQKYAERLELRGGLATLNLDAFPDDLLERVAQDVLFDAGQANHNQRTRFGSGLNYVSGFGVIFLEASGWVYRFNELGFDRTQVELLLHLGMAFAVPF